MKRKKSPIRKGRKNAPPVIFCFWTGDNKLTENRIRNLKTIKNTDLDVHFVTKNNLHEYILKDHPLHEGYEYLSAVHKSDYLRTYFLHFYGGAYSDIKKQTQSFRPALEMLNKDTSIYGIGYPEKHRDDVAVVPNSKLYKKLRKNYKFLLGNGCYIFKPNTPFTQEWYDTLLNTMDKKYEKLKIYPAQTTRQRYTEEYPYPFRWAELLGEIFHPLCLKYKHNLLRNLECPYCENYD